ncbi:FIST C-terminal domain-containing protein [Shewanella sp. D64]|uniref:nitric oxide-sensing protein NosP n=1 Tax=unclassified Shewanella TaxID=196818 RepID=UPI0022BA2263|nr:MULTISPECIES: nitric oxide-sensing protein NosP [unclassified Shewanella]MEC4724155.1 FIST C-terminal domain-containing protein [Shewanella sp. D64]MEC4736175.1 FIST C-terminal domain-containing protein [Shewanella sp. E94]WBJ97889.1 FIST C-terminal domain-containing protein [Shewanella sp. MTB7]
MTKIKTKYAVSRTQAPRLASQEIFEQLGQPQTGFVLFYCSVVYPLEALASAMNNQFIDVELAGCTTAGELTCEGYEQHSIVAIWFSPDFFAISVELIPAIETFDLINAQTKINQLIEKCSEKALTPIKNNTFLLTLIDGLSTKEEQLLSILNSAANGIPHFGGSAGDDTNLANTHVYHQGVFHQQAAITIMVNTLCQFKVFNCNHIKSSIEKLVVTQADAQSRTVYELNSEPAALVYAQFLGLGIDELNPDVFSLHPLAVKIGGNYYIRSIQKVNKNDFSLTFYCAVDTGIVLSAVEMSNIIESLSDKLITLEQRFDKPELVLACDCFLRRLEIEQKNLIGKIKPLQEQYRMFGFNTYGEHINGMHLNQTFTGVYISGELNE